MIANRFPWFFRRRPRLSPEETKRLINEHIAAHEELARREPSEWDDHATHLREYNEYRRKQR